MQSRLWDRGPKGERTPAILKKETTLHACYCASLGCKSHENTSKNLELGVNGKRPQSNVWFFQQEEAGKGPQG